MKNIYNSKGKYIIQKYINGKNRRFGTYDRLCDAQRVRDVLEEIGWGCRDLKPMRNIYKVKYHGYEYYRVVKQKDNKVVWCSHHKNVEDAMLERDLLEKNDWDVDLL